MIVLWAGYIFFNIKYNKYLNPFKTLIFFINEYLNPFKTLIFFITAIWLIYYPFSNHSQCYFGSLDPQFYYIPEKGKESITAVYNMERMKELIPKICQNKASSNMNFNKRYRIWDYIVEKRKEDVELLEDDSSYFFDTESKRYKELSAELRKVDIEKQKFINDCETKYFNIDYSHFWNIVNDVIYTKDILLVKEFSHKYVKGRISYDVYNYYEKDTHILLYSSKTRTIFSSFLYRLKLGGGLIPIPDITTDYINLVTYD